jgi:uncharacterized protein
MRAAKEAEIRSPLIDAQLTKEEIRTLSKEMNLPTWDMPSMTCLASRIPYGEAISLERISRVEEAETVLRDIGFKQVRVRSHGALARVEVDSAEVDGMLRTGVRQRIIKGLKGLGFGYITVDLEGYREGSMNEALREDVRTGNE